MACSKKFLLILHVVVLASTCVCISAQDMLINVSKLEMFVDELQDMSKVYGYDIVKGVPKFKSLEIGMFSKFWKFHRDIPPTQVFAFGTSMSTATVPGPTIEALQGIDTYVTWQNHLPQYHILPWDPTIPTAKPRTGIPTVVHLHGGIEEPESDGNPNAWFTAGFKEVGPTWKKRIFHYRNLQHPGNLMYHDHALGLTRVNLLAGLLGAYIIRDPVGECNLGLPSGDEFDRSLIILDRSFRVDGSIYLNSTGNNPTIHPQWQPEYFGDAMIVNGKAWPYMKVRRRRYRFRIINASNARYLRIFFDSGLEFIHVGSDSAYIKKPVVTNTTLLGPSEIADVVVDFSKSTANTAVLANDAPYPYPSGNPVDDANSKVMKFIISKQPEKDKSRVPQELIDYPSPDLSKVSRTRYITMFEYTSNNGEVTHLYLNGIPFKSPVTETPRAGTSELWNVINLTPDNHPFHIHLGLFEILDQTELVHLQEFKDCMTKLNDAERCDVKNHAQGNRTEVVPQEKGWKNVYKMAPGYVTKILVRFSYIHTNSSYPFDPTNDPGYLYHCHILDHEDNEMMRPLKLIQ